MKRILIIGGGFAGLAAGVELAEQGFEVELLERRPYLGGRAYSFIDAVSGETVDNGQHLFMGCYRETFRFLRKLGTDNLIRVQSRPRVDFLDGNGGPAVFECPSLPAPLHLLAGLLTLRGLTVGDKLKTLRVGSVLRLNGDETAKRLGHLTVDEWLTQCGQSDRIKERFWNMFSVATLNEDPKVAPATLLARVLQEAFGGSRRDSSMAMASVGLSELYTEQSRAFIESRGGRIRMRTTAAEIFIEGSVNGEMRCRGAKLSNGEILEADSYISAVPYFALRPMLPPNLFESVPYFAKWSAMRSAPIVSINIWFDRPVTELGFAGLLGGRIQWLFNKDLLFSRSRRDKQLLSFVISAAHEFQDLSKERLIEMALEDLKRFLPAASEAKIVRTLVVKERCATLSATVKGEAGRPAAQTPIRNLLLAGDWTNTGLPATIEGAVLSGRRCADIINNR